MTDEILRLREEVSEQIKALGSSRRSAMAPGPCRHQACTPPSTSRGPHSPDRLHP